ncbi:MAG: TIGR02594 family protein [Armatimonadia bacterium]
MDTGPDLPARYRWLLDEPGPRILLEGLKTYGTIEKPGAGNNPSIMAWARATGLDRVYRNDATAWCGLWMAYVALQAGWEPPLNPLAARNWLNWGTPQRRAALGDVLVFWRERRTGFKGHVGDYVGEDDEAYHVMGGNQGDRVSIKRISKSRLLGIRRCPWRINQPANVRPIKLAASGTLSTNEA